MKKRPKTLMMFFRPILLIAWADLRLLVINPWFVLSAGAFCVILSSVFPRELFQFAASYMTPVFGGQAGGRNIHEDVFIPHLSIVNLLLLFFAPSLSMRLLAEEKKQSSFDLLITAPITNLQIVMGKYLALLAALFCFIALAAAYPLSVSFFADIPQGLLAASFLGLLLLTAVYAAAGLFASSLTAAPWLGMIMGIVFNIALWFISQGRDLSDNPMFQGAMEYLSLASHFVNFIKGSLVVSSIVFFLSCIVFFLFLTHKAIEFNRWRP